MTTAPAFAVVGDPNAGKSTVVATLAEDDTVEISRRAGTTKEATNYDHKLGDKTILTFVDLPGFEHPALVREWFEAHKDQPGNLPAAFVEAHENRNDLKADCEILRSLKGVALLFVVDATRLVERRDRDQAEILRLCGNPRMAIMNVRGGEPDEEDEREILNEWKELLGKFGTCLSFDPHRANFRDRLELLEGISHVMPEWKKPVQRAIEIFRDEWENRRLPEAADAVRRLVENTIGIHKQASTANRTEEEARNLAKKRVENEIREFEDDFRRRIRQLFRHNQENWSPPESDLLQLDLFSERVWALFGLNRTQLVAAGAAVGAALGAGLDLLFVGLTFGIFTGLGALLVGGGAWLAADKPVDVHLGKFKVPGVPIRIPLGRIKADDQAVATVDAKSNLPWILMDRALLYIRAAATWSHGRTEPAETTEASEVEESGITRHFDEEERKILSAWMGFEKAKGIAKWLDKLKWSKKAQKIQEDREGAARDVLLEQIRKLTDTPREGWTPSSE